MQQVHGVFAIARLLVVYLILLCNLYCYFCFAVSFCTCLISVHTGMYHRLGSSSNLNAIALSIGRRQMTTCQGAKTGASFDKSQQMWG